LDPLGLLGLRQAYQHWRGVKLAPQPFATPALYRLVRHPLMLGFLVAFWSTPRMTWSQLLFALGMSAYILIGLRYEERDLLRAFGNAYASYRQRVPLLVPFARRAKSAQIEPFGVAYGRNEYPWHTQINSRSKAMSSYETPMQWFTRAVLWFVAANALAGGLVLLLFPTHTDTLFFWTINPPINARLFGALYLGGAVAVGALARRGVWEPARFLVPVLVTAGLLIAGTTLLHTDKFSAGLRLAYWLLVYIVAPLLALVLYVLQTRAGSSWAVRVPVTNATRRLALISGAAILAGGLPILAWPANVAPLWPWPASALMLRIFAAWFCAFGVGLLWFRVERDWRRLTPLVNLMIASSALDLLIVALHADQLRTTGLPLWLYCAHLVGLGMVGVSMHWLQRPAQAKQGRKAHPKAAEAT
ncbi:MAG: hypothetical protein H7Y32_03180, partial [Chloroflexales bacterium]|nr:hypothetical protein [Chloroflexales bacterium]